MEGTFCEIGGMSAAKCFTCDRLIAWSIETGTPNRLTWIVEPAETMHAKGLRFNLAGDPEDTEKIPRLACRFHDCRRTAVSRMIDAGVPLPKIAKIVGWSPATMVRMAARYGHFSLEELRRAVETISKGRN